MIQQTDHEEEYFVCVGVCVCAFVKGVNRGHTSDSAKGNVDTLPTGDVPICALPA